MSYTEVIISFDTEDFTSNRAADAIRDTAIALREEGVRANYNMVGLLAKQLIEWRRFDVLDALKSHEISFHSKTHSLHPTLVEYTDLEDYDAAHELALREESEGIGMVCAATGATKLTAAVTPGSNKSYVAQYVYAESGINVYCDGPIRMPDGDAVWMCGLLQMGYDTVLEAYLIPDNFDAEAFVEAAATRKRCILYNHPNRITHSEYWDLINYIHKNRHEWGEWEEAPRHSEAVVQRFYDRLRTVVRMMKEAKNEDGTPKFKFITLGELYDEVKRDRKVRREDLRVYRDALKAQVESGNLTPLVFSKLGIEAISLSECLYSAAEFALTDRPTVDLNGKIIKGFLDKPQGVECEVPVTRDELFEAVRSIDFKKFLPSAVVCGSKEIGPLDLLVALLDCMVDGLTEIRISPKEQQPSLDDFPMLRKQNLRGNRFYTDDFMDNYISERQRLQAWTIHN